MSHLFINKIEQETLPHAFSQLSAPLLELLEHADNVFSNSLLTRTWNHICRTLILDERLLLSLWLQICCPTKIQNKGNFRKRIRNPLEEKGWKLGWIESAVTHYSFCVCWKLRCLIISYISILEMRWNNTYFDTIFLLRWYYISPTVNHLFMFYKFNKY